MSQHALIKGLGEILVATKALTRADLEALTHTFAQREMVRFEEFLLDEGLVSKQALLTALETYYKLPAVDVAGIFFDHHLVTSFPKDVMLRKGFIPYERDGDVLEVIVADPQDEALLSVIGSHVSYDIVIVVGIYREICDAIKEYYDEALTVSNQDDEELSDESPDDIIEL